MSNIQPPFNGVVKTIFGRYSATVSRMVMPSVSLLALLFAICSIGPINGEPFGSETGVGIHIGGANLGSSDLLKCPRVCSCSGQTVDCSHRGLTQVPRRIPLDTERL